jgi:hypothetical protein
MNKPFNFTLGSPVRHKQRQHLSQLLVGALKFFIGWIKGFGNKDILFVSPTSQS